ncbi:uncharacterized protein LOC144746996 [Ciona intestinalis]
MTLNDGSSVVRQSVVWTEIVQNQTSQVNPDGNITQNIVRVNLQGTFFNVFITSDKPLGPTTNISQVLKVQGVGLGGTPDKNLNNEIVDSKGNYVKVEDLSRQVIVEEFATSASVIDSNDEMFIYNDEEYSEPRVPTAGGNCLSQIYNLTNTNTTMENSTLGNTTSSPNATLPSYMIVTSDYLPESTVSIKDNVSLEFYFKLNGANSSGVFFSYLPPNNTDETGFDLAVIDNAIKLGCNGSWIDTSICPPTYKTFCDWGMIVINCDRATGDIWLIYVTSSGGVYVGRRISSSEINSLTRYVGGGSVWFRPGSRLSLGGGSFINRLNLNGGWYGGGSSSTNGGGSSTHSGYYKPFGGSIDEVHVWKRTLISWVAFKTLGLSLVPICCTVELLTDMGM